MITNLLKYTCILFICIFFSCSADITDMHGQEEEPIKKTTFRPMAHTGFADIYEEGEALTRVSPAISELLNRMRYIVYNAVGNIVQEKKLTPAEMEDGFQVMLPAGDYRICVLGEGRIVNYIPPGTISDDIRDTPAFKAVWVSAYQSARKPVYRDYFFGISEFKAGSLGVNPIVIKRATGMLQVEVKEKNSDISIKEISVGFPQNGMQNNFHTDGTYSCSNQQPPTSSEPYAIHHSLRYVLKNNYFEGIYFPTTGGSITCDLTISYHKKGKVYTREIKLNDFLIEANKRTRLPIVIKE